MLSVEEINKQYGTQYNSVDDNIYVLSCNPSEDSFFIGCSMKKYISEFSKYFSHSKILGKEKNDLNQFPVSYPEETKSIVKDYLGLKKCDGIYEVYISVKRHLDDFFIAQTPVYPFHHMWNGYTPWRCFDDCVIKELIELKFLRMTFNKRNVISKEEKHILDIHIVKGNIVDFHCDAIVNAANEQLQAGGGVCGAIFNAAGEEKLQKACDKIGYCKTGEAVITDSFKLKSKYIIHTVGPIYRDDSSERYLKRAYINTLAIADEYCCKSVALPSISTGIYGYPKDNAVKIALDAIINYHAAVLRDVTIVCFDDETFKLYNEELKRQQRLNKIKGCVLGGAMGDALGYAVEFNTYEEIQNKYGKEGIREYDLVDGKAIISDDTQMSLFTICGLLWWQTTHKMKGISKAGVDYIYWAYLDWLETQGIKAPKHTEVSWIKCRDRLHVKRAPGNTCLSALTSGKIGTPEERINSSKGCGGVMRVAPVGLLYETAKPCESSKDGADVAAITHGHDLALIPSEMLVYIIQSIMNSVYMSVYDVSLKEHITDALESVLWNNKDSKHIEYFGSLINKAIDLSSKGNKPIDDIKQLGEGWVAEEALAIAIYSVLKAKSFEDAIIIAVNHDGDSDSTGAIAGNIAGAFYGYNKIPVKFKENLELKNTMKELSEDLCDGCQMAEYKNYHNPKWIKKYMPYY